MGSTPATRRVVLLPNPAGGVTFVAIKSKKASTWRIAAIVGAAAAPGDGGSVVVRTPMQVVHIKVFPIIPKITPAVA